ncbi:MAG: phage tail protein [Sulfurospirillum sp.]|nr:phage tail protein [Sulfurospirillum sp.]
MICMIDDFYFDIKESESIAKKLSLPFAKNARLGKSVHHQAIGLYDESFTLEVVYYNKKRDYLKYFEAKIKAKKPLWMVFGDGVGHRVLVSECEIVKSYFDANGSPLKQELKLSIEVYYE